HSAQRPPPALRDALPISPPTDRERLMLRHTRQPRDAEINAGHVVNTVPPVWFEDARFGLYAPIQELSGPDALFGIVRKASYDYQDRKSTRLNSSHVKISY